MRLQFLMLPTISSFMLSLSATMAVAVSLSKPNCPEKCGNVTIPYPFGIGSKCSANSSFTVICLNSTRPFLSSINMEALHFFMEGAVRVKLPVSPMNCSDVQETRSISTSLLGSPFTISVRYNSFVVLGCQNVVWLHNRRYSFDNNIATNVSGCTAICEANSTDSNCNGVNCCLTKIPQGLNHELRYTYRSINNEATSNGSFCGYAFPVDTAKWFEEDYKRYKGLQNDLLNPFDHQFDSAPLLLEWTLDDEALCPSGEFFNETYCESYNFCAQNNFYSPTTRKVHGCNFGSCYNGFEGNPYLPGGCSEMFLNENEMYHKTRKVHGRNFCRCYDGFEGNPYLPGGCSEINGATFPPISDEHKKSRVKIIVIGTVSSVVGALVLLVGVWRSVKAIKVIIKRIKANRRHKFFKRNGGLLLQQHLSSSDKYGVEKTKLFGSKELARATDRYNENRILGRGGQGIVYKGMLTDGRIVAVKKPNDKVREGDVEVFINEVVILSQINHRNVVRLLGCCLETEVPLLVYEFIPNGTLFQHIHEPDEEYFPLSWEMRLRIAREVAGALSYLHSAASAPIYHRDIKSTNILLDEKYRAKVSDFGTSRTVSIDQTHLTTRVLGTFGYLDPEYFQSSQFTEKSDVYSFGVVMVELLTGEKAISSIRASAGKSLATHFLHSMEEENLFEIVDARALKEGTKEEIMAFSQVARRCLHLNGKRRPTMKEVAYELEGVQLLVKEADSLEDNCVHDRDYILSEQHAIELGESYDDFTSLSGR